LGSAFNKFWSPSTSGAIFAAPPQIAYTTEARSNYESWLSENMLTYTHSFGKNNINALADYSAQKYNYNYNYIYAFGFPDDKINTLNAATNFTASSDVEEWTLLSWVGRLNYNYDNKYLSSVSIRRDGSSRFGYNNQYGNFPSISAGWVISQENFMKRFNPISFLKIRGSYGLTGNNNIGNYSSYAAVSNTNYSFNEALANGRSVTSLSNSDLGWEKTSQLDLGLDLALLAGRISFTYDYYNKITANLLYAVNVPQESGYSNIATNVGEFRFWGHEFSVNTFNLTGIFKWKTNFNISFDRNIVAKLGINNAPIYGAYTITKVGAPIGQFYGYVFNGIYMNQADFDNSPKNVTSAVGSVKYKDISGPNGVPDGIIDANDQTAIGNPNPNYIYGMTNTFNYKDFDLNIVIAGSEGNKIMNQVEEYTQNLDGPFNVLKNVANRWKSVSDPGAGLLPSCEAGTTALARATNSRWVENGSYLTVKNITLGYNMPIKNKGFIIRSARFYVSIQQAFVFTKYSGANPEVSSNGSDPLNLGVDQTAYPVPRTCTIGVNIGL
jgi:TonB-linked SusC/RagA family outer membrane protein